jgi:hypothetical protein
MLIRGTPIIIAIGFVLFINLFSGCSFKDIFGGTEFSMTAWSVSDYEGYPSLSLTFSCSDTVTVEIIGPNSNKIDTDFFFKGEYEKTFHIAEYRHSVMPGKYYLKVYDNDRDLIFTRAFTFKGSELSIVLCDQKWWKRESPVGGYSFFGLRLNVLNNGDTPEYPYEIETIFDSENYSSLAMPNVINPGYFEDIDYFMYKKTEPTNKLFKVYIKNVNGDILASKSFETDIKDNVPVEQFSFTYNNIVKKIKIPKPEFLFDYYLSLDRFYDDDYTPYILNPYDDGYIDVITEILLEGFDSTNNEDKINFVASFVQNLEYKSDSEKNASYEYPSYPLETIFYENGGGDCEDKSILAAHIIKNMGYEVALLRFPNHMAVGVKLFDGSYSWYTQYVDDYYFLETTTGGKPLGFIPSEYAEAVSNVTVYPVLPKPVLTHNWFDNNIIIYTNTDRGDIVKVILIIENLGNLKAQNISVEAGFYTLNDFRSNFNAVTIPSIEMLESKQIILTVDIPKNIETWFKTRIYLDGNLEDEKESISAFP